MSEQKCKKFYAEMPNVPNTPTVAILIEYSRSHRYARHKDTYWHGVSVGLGTALRIIGVPDDVRDGFEALWRRCFEEAEVAPADFMRNCRDLRRDIENPGADLDAEIEDCKRAISTATEAEKAEHERKAGGNYNIQ